MTMKLKIYIETSVVSYLVSSYSENIRVAGHQIVTREFWKQLQPYQIYISDTVVEESSRGDSEKASLRLEAISRFEVLEISDSVQDLANALVLNSAVPKKCPEDALHIACAAANNINFIVTWNFKHINNPFMIKQITNVVEQAGYSMPVICSPEEFMEAKDG
jgi:predicted nucleic acid-binding protein